MKEVNMYKRLKAALPTVFMQRIESVIGLGIPDVAYAVGSVAGWIELKELSRIPKKIAMIPWRPGQLAWYHKYRQLSSAPYFLILTIIDDWYLISDIKGSYTIDELSKYYISDTKNLHKPSTALYRLLKNH